MRTQAAEVPIECKGHRNFSRARERGRPRHTGYGRVLAISGVAASPIVWVVRAKVVLGKFFTQEFETFFRRVHDLKQVEILWRDYAASTMAWKL